MTPQPAAVEIASEDGAVLRGQLWAGAAGWVLLVHDRGEDQDLDCWLPLAPLLAARDWTVLAVDMRGHGGSDGEWDAQQAGADLALLVRFARARGAAIVAIVVAGESAVTALRGAPELRLDAMVLLSPAIAPEQPLDGLRGAGEAKLIVVGGGDPAARAAGERLVRSAIGWVLLVNLPTVAQGAEMLWQPGAEHLTEHLLGFLAEQRFVGRGRTAPAGQSQAAPLAARDGPDLRLESDTG